MSRVLVTGGAGYIGSHAVAKLLEAGFAVTVYDNLSNGFRELVPSGAQIVVGDIRETDRLAALLRDSQISSVMHFAAFTAVEESLRDPAKYYGNNFEGTVSLLKACEQAGVKNFIFSSTAAVYANPENAFVDETSKVDPVTPYGCSKLMSEQALRDLSAVNPMKYMILRYFNVAGAELSGARGQVGDHHTALVKRAALAAAGKVPGLKIMGTDYATPDGTAIRDYIHVEDLAEIHVQALQYLLGGGASELLNCGYGRGYSVREVIQTMKKVSGVDFPVEETGRRPGDLAAVVAENRKLLGLLGWRPQRDDLAVICRSAYEWEVRPQSLGNP